MKTTSLAMLVSAPLLVVGLIGCSDAEQEDFADRAEEMGEQMARGMDRLGQRMDELLGETETDLEALGTRLGELDSPEFKERVGPELEQLRAEMGELRDRVAEGADLDPRQEERLEGVEDEVERLADRVRTALEDSDAGLESLGDEMKRTLERLQGTLEEIQREMESGRGG